MVMDFGHSICAERELFPYMKCFGGTHYPPEAVAVRGARVELKYQSVIQRVGECQKMDSWGWACCFLKALKMMEYYGDHKNVHLKGTKKENPVFGFQKAILKQIKSRFCEAPDEKSKQLGNLLTGCFLDVSERYSMEDIVNHSYFR